MPTITVRVCADKSTRAARGWVFTSGVDDAASECALDHYPTPWTHVIANDSTAQHLHAPIARIVHDVMQCLQSLCFCFLATQHTHTYTQSSK